MTVQTCSMCGRTADAAGDGDPPLGWTVDFEDVAGDEPRARWICPECTRRFVRSIEAKLDQQWW